MPARSSVRIGVSQPSICSGLEGGKRQGPEPSVQAHLRDRARREVQVRGPDRAGVAQEVREVRLRVGREIEGREGAPPGTGDDRRARARRREARGLVAHERIRIHLRDLLQERRDARVLDAREGVQDLQAQVLLGVRLLVGLEQAGQGLRRSPDPEGRGRREARFRVLQHLQQVGQGGLVAHLRQRQGGAVAQPPVVGGEEPDAVGHGLRRADRDRDRDGQGRLDGVGAVVALEEGADELGAELAQGLDRAVLRRPVGRAEGAQEGVGDTAGVLGRDDARGELTDLGIGVGEQRQDLVVARLGLGEQGAEGRDRRVLHAVGVVAAVLQERADVRLVGVLREDLHGPVAQLLVVVVEGMQGHPGRARRRRRFDDREGLLAQRRRASRGQHLRDPRKRPLVRVLAEVVERRVHDDRIGVAQEPLETLQEVPAGQRLERRHGLAADRLGLGSEEREDGRGGGLVGKAFQERETRLAQRHVGIDREPGEVVRLEVRRGGDRLQDLVALDLRLPAARAQLVEEGLGAGSPSFRRPHVVSSQFRESDDESRGSRVVCEIRRKGWSQG